MAAEGETKDNFTILLDSLLPTDTDDTDDTKTKLIEKYDVSQYKSFINKISKDLSEIDTQIESIVKNESSFYTNIKTLQINTFKSFLLEAMPDCTSEISEIINAFETKITNINDIETNITKE